MNAVVYIQNLKCHGCAHTIKTQLEKMEGVSMVGVNNDDDSVSFEYTRPEDLDAVTDKLSSLGYPTADSPNSIAKKAKSFVSCAVGRINQ
ncbi:MAG: heavy metal-associated domain-containing protein [Bacteroidota bacterium]